MPKIRIPKTPALIGRSPEQALRSVISKSGLGVYASSDRLFKGAVFGRDSLEVAEDLITIRPQLVRQILLTMVALQGQKINAANEEEPGKIIHEYRTTRIDGKPLEPDAREIFNRLSLMWGGDQHELAYYGSIDSTPLFIKVIALYCKEHGDKLLSERVKNIRSGQVVSVLEALDAACEWLTGQLKKSKFGLLEFKRTNPHGIENQAWKDSLEFYIHTNGQLANHGFPIASVEVQAIAYDALMLVTKMLPSWNLTKRASKLRDLTIKKLWMEEANYFALGLDRRDAKHERIIKTITANPAEMLRSTFFNELNPRSRQKYISAIIKKIMSPEFLTDGGTRSRAMSEAHLVNFWDYHGSYTTWIKETFDIAEGMRYQGFPKLAQELYDRIDNVVRASGAYREFYYVDRFGRVLGTEQTLSTHGEIVFVASKNRPEKTQAWTVSAMLAIKKMRSKLQTVRQQPWQTELERDILRQIPHVRRLRSNKELSARYPFYPYQLRKDG